MNQRRGGEDTTAWQKIVNIGQQLVPGHDVLAGASAGGVDMVDEPSSESLESVDMDSGSVEEQQTLAPELDLDIGESETGAVEELEEAAESVEFDLSETGVEAAESSETEEGIEFGLDETQAFEAAQSTQEFSLDIEASELGIDDEETGEIDAGDSGEFDFDLSAEAEQVLAADDENENAELSLDGVDEASLEFDASEALAEESPDEEAEVLDLSETSIEQAVVEKVAEPETAQPEIKPVPTASSMDDDLDLSDLDDIDEVSTKLDLAKAYLDMGDADGTRSILDEVMTEGNDDQKKEADDLLRQLG
jgi:pilus assembly protein FimV